jgi:5-methyltetrahydropteroyltriglutamate--homocysteine methyltransferase
MADNSRHDPPFRGEHIGSLLRPRRLIEAYRAFKAGGIDGDGLAATQDECILEIIKLQEDIGLVVRTAREVWSDWYSPGF